MTLLALVASCGGQSNTTSSGHATTGSLAARQDAFVAFYRTFIADFPARKSSTEAAVRARSALAQGHVDLRAAGRAFGAFLAYAEAWQRSMQALPAANSDLEPIRAKYVAAAADEVQFARDYIAVLRAGVRGVVDKTVAQQGEALRAKLQSVNAAASNETNHLVERLGGEAAFRGRIDLKRAEELLSAMRQEAAG